MKYKFATLFVSVLVTTGLIHSFESNLAIQSVFAQSASKAEEFNLEQMDLDNLDAILRENISDIEAKPGQWQFSINDVAVIAIADSKANRMRIVAPVTNADKLTAEQVQKMLIANFHTSLDARYAVSKGFVVSTFVHPLNSLQEKDLLSALNQVVSLVKTFGSTYSSGELLFVPNGGEVRRNPSSENNISI